MRQPSELRDELAAIDATLAGEAVDPVHAELAELSLLLVAARPELDPAAAARLDARVAAVPRRAALARRGPRVVRWRPVAGALSVVAGAGVAAVVALSGGGSTSPAVNDLSAPAVVQSATTSAAGAASAPSAGPVLHAAQPGRAVVQSAQLTLTTAPTHVEQVASEVFAAVGAAGGYVTSSTVTQTGGADGSAELRLSLPSSSLAQTLGALSRLRDASVASRSDATQDVTDTLGAERRRLADARALRTALLRQLAGASTPGQIASLRGRLHDAEAAIEGAAAAVRHTERQVAFSQVAVSIQAASPAPVPVHHRAPVARALRVLGAIGSALLLAAVILVPLVVLLAALLWSALRGRRAWRERGL